MSIAKGIWRMFWTVLYRETDFSRFVDKINEDSRFAFYFDCLLSAWKIELVHARLQTLAWLPVKGRKGECNRGALRNLCSRTLAVRAVVIRLEQLRRVCTPLFTWFYAIFLVPLFSCPFHFRFPLIHTSSYLSFTPFRIFSSNTFISLRHFPSLVTSTIFPSLILHSLFVPAVPSTQSMLLLIHPLFTHRLFSFLLSLPLFTFHHLPLSPITAISYSLPSPFPHSNFLFLLPSLLPSNEMPPWHPHSLARMGNFNPRASRGLEKVKRGSKVPISTPCGEGKAAPW